MRWVLRFQCGGCFREQRLTPRAEEITPAVLLQSSETERASPLSPKVLPPKSCGISPLREKLLQKNKYSQMFQSSPDLSHSFRKHPVVSILATYKKNSISKKRKKPNPLHKAAFFSLIDFGGFVPVCKNCLYYPENRSN